MLAGMPSFAVPVGRHDDQARAAPVRVASLAVVTIRLLQETLAACPGRAAERSAASRASGTRRQLVQKMRSLDGEPGAHGSSVGNPTHHVVAG